MKREKNSKKVVLTVIIAFIMITSVIGFVTMREEKNNNVGDKISYNGYDFIKVEEGWLVNINKRQFVFRYNPKELENIDVNYVFNANKLYIAYDASNTDQNIKYFVDKLTSIFELVGIRPVQACISEEKCPNIPIVDCKSNNKMIEIKKSEESKISLEDNCLLMEGSVDYLDKATEKIVYKLLGVV